MKILADTSAWIAYFRRENSKAAELLVDAILHHQVLLADLVIVEILRGLVGTWCIENDVPLLHNDRDYAAMERHLGLKRWSGSG